MFVDRINLELYAGKGGDGCVSFRRERYVPRGGPDGGDGGHGGSIIFFAEAGVNNLATFAHRKQLKAERGKHGSGRNKRGRDGADIRLPVPPGTIVWDLENQFILKDLTEAGEEFIAAKGGRGGKGNWRFKSSTNQVPRESTPGEEGEARRVTLELKVIADVGLIGKPNAGKSTLLSRLTRARPEIADYPFTTKHPNLGQVMVDMDRSFVMADIPGLIEGASQGTGLGHEFLRHIERAGILVHLVEPLPMDGTDPVANYQSIRAELTQYQESLGNRPEVIAVTKAELPNANDIRERLENEIGLTDVLTISAVTGQGLNELTQRVLRHLDAEPS